MFYYDSSKTEYIIEQYKTGVKSAETDFVFDKAFKFYEKILFKWKTAGFISRRIKGVKNELCIFTSKKCCIGNKNVIK